MSTATRTSPHEVSAQLMPAFRPPTRTRRTAARIGIELGWVVGMLVLYNVGRYIAKQHVGPAFDNAMQLWDFERWMKIPSEQTLQSTVLHAWPWGIEMANRYYATVHFPLTLAFLVWMFVRRPDYYLWIRRSLVILTSAALVGHLAFPLAPPRMLPQLGFVDTGVLFHMSVYGADGANSIANQYAAMPSLHVAWAALVAVGLITSTRTRWRWFWMIHPVLTLAVVVVTANHYWLDGIIGLLLLVTALTVTVRARPVPEAEDDDAEPVEASAEAPAEESAGTTEVPAEALEEPARARVRVSAGSSRSAASDTPSDTLDTPKFRP